jgi:hypothetical protein
MLTWTKYAKRFALAGCSKWGTKASAHVATNRLLKLWSYTVTAEQDIFLPDWEGRSHIAVGFCGFNSWWPIIDLVFFSHDACGCKDPQFGCWFLKISVVHELSAHDFKFWSLVQCCAKNVEVGVLQKKQ